MLTEKVQKALNDQFNAELYSSYLYLSMHAYFKSISLDGFANWMYQQAKEELLHAMKFYNFINQRGGRARTAAVAEPPSEWDSPLAGFFYVGIALGQGSINDIPILTNELSSDRAIV